MNDRDWQQLLSESVARERATENKFRDLAAKQTALFDIIEHEYELASEFSEYHPYSPIVVAFDWEQHFPEKIDGFGR